MGLLMSKNNAYLQSRERSWRARAGVAYVVAVFGIIIFFVPGHRWGILWCSWVL